MDKMKMLLLLSSLLLLFGCTNTDGYPESEIEKTVCSEYTVPVIEAIEIASAIVLPGDLSQTKSSVRSVKSTKSINRGGKDPFFHIVNYEEGGFIIIAGDKRVDPILAYSYDGYLTFDETEYPEGFCMWMDNVVDSIVGIRVRNLEPDFGTTSIWDNLSSIETKAKPPGNTNMCEYEGQYFPNYQIIVHGPLISTTWHQGVGYNNALDSKGCSMPANGKPPVGCVPLAAGQLMKYYGKPTNKSWSSMPNTSGSVATQNLLKELGQYLQADYGCSGTSAFTSDIPYVLKNTYGYSYAIYKSYNYSDIYSYIAGSKPVILRGQGSSGGHAWICDGLELIYDYICNKNQSFYSFDQALERKYLHMVWGWSQPELNSYCAEGYFGAGGHSFNSSVSMVLAYP